MVMQMFDRCRFSRVFEVIDNFYVLYQMHVILFP